MARWTRPPRYGRAECGGRDITTGDPGTGTNGGTGGGVAVVTLTNLAGQFYRQGTTKAGYITLIMWRRLSTRYKSLRPAYERAVKQVEASENHSTRLVVVLQRGSGDVALAAQLAAMNPKAQKEMGKAIEALRANRFGRSAESSGRLPIAWPQIRLRSAIYLGVTRRSWGDAAQARSYWTKTVELYPNHVRALLSLSEILIREKKPDHG